MGHAARGTQPLSPVLPFHMAPAVARTQQSLRCLLFLGGGGGAPHESTIATERRQEAILPTAHPRSDGDAQAGDGSLRAGEGGGGSSCLAVASRL